MSTDFFYDTSGNLWWCDLDAISNTLRDWSQAQANVDALSIDKRNPVWELNFDQRRFRNDRERHRLREMGYVAQNISTAPDRVVSQLVRCYQQTPGLEQVRRSQFRIVQIHNSGVINGRVTAVERIVIGLRITRDVSATIFMCCIPGLGLGRGLSMLLQGGVSVFQGVGTYQDTGNVGVAIATSALSFKSQVFVLPQTATRVAQIIFKIVTRGGEAVLNSGIRMMTIERNSTTTFTNVLTQELTSAGLGEASGPLLGAINNRLSGKVLPVLVDVAGGQGTTALATPIAGALQPSDNQGTSNSTVRGAIAADRLRQEIERRRNEANEARWQLTPLYRYLATGDPTMLLSQAQLYVMGKLLRRGE